MNTTAPHPVNGACPACGKWVALALRAEPPQWACIDINCEHGHGHPLPEWTPRRRQQLLDDIAGRYDPSVDNYAAPLDDDPRCLWGWGPPSCRHRFGHTCFRALGHSGRCGDAGDRAECPRTRPKNWDTIGRAEANR